MQSFRVNIKINSNKALQSGAYVLVYIAIIYERSEEGPKNVILCSESVLACLLPLCSKPFTKPGFSNVSVCSLS